MSFDWSEYFVLAQELAGRMACSAGQEARLRAAISRAYYGAFCKGRNHLRDNEGHRMRPGENVHQYVRNKFKNSADKLRKQIGHDLDRLRSDRNKADYDDTVARLEAMLDADLALAGKVLSSLGRL